MNDQLPNADEKRAVERWENEGGKCVDHYGGRTRTLVQNKRKGLVK